MKSRAIFIVIFFLIVEAVLFAKPKMAVLDAIAHSGVKESIIIPVTENIIESLVACGKYTVLDRAHVTKIMEEKKFQLSGIVKDSDIKTLGNYLGAEIIVIIDISIIEDIYFVSAKMIDVESGEIKSQASHRKKGDVSVIFEIAEVVGKKLTGAPADTTSIEDTSLDNIVKGDLSEILYETTPEKTMVFYANDMMVAGMKGKKIHVEFDISQDKKWLDRCQVKMDPVVVLYDPSYWNDNAYKFTYPLTLLSEVGDPSKPFLAVFYIIDTDKDSVIFQKSIEFSLSKSKIDNIFPPVTDSKYFSKIAMSYVAAAYFGDVIDILYEPLEEYGYGYTSNSVIFDFYWMQQLFLDMYISASITYNSTSVDYEDVNFNTSTAEMATMVDIQMGLGFMLPIIKNVQAYYGFRMGNCLLTMGNFPLAVDIYYFSNYPLAYSEQSAFSLSIEAGIDMAIMKTICLSVKTQFETILFSASYGEGVFWYSSPSLNSVGVTIGMGYVY